MRLVTLHSWSAFRFYRPGALLMLGSVGVAAACGGHDSSPGPASNGTAGHGDSALAGSGGASHGGGVSSGGAAQGGRNTAGSSGDTAVSAGQSGAGVDGTAGDGTDTTTGGAAGTSGGRGGGRADGGASATRGAAGTSNGHAGANSGGASPAGVGGIGGVSGEAGVSGTSGDAGAASDAGAPGITVTFDIHDNLASDVDSDAPGTVGIVTWTTNLGAVTSAEIDFGLDTTYGMVAPVDLTDPTHRTLLLGMKPARAYHFRVVARTGGQAYPSQDNVINTGPPTTLVPLADYNIVKPASHQPGFIVTSYWTGLATAIPFILDGDGDIVWWAVGVPREITRAAMSATGKNMWFTVAGAMSGNAGTPLMRMSMDTLESQTYPDTRGTHDITPVSGETMAYLDYGEPDCASIFEIDPTGTTREVFESTGIVQSAGCHGNAVRYSQSRDLYMFSELNQDILFVNRSDGSLAWRLSDRVSGGSTAWGGRTHGVQLLSDSVLIHANFGGPGSTAAGIEYSLAGDELARFEGGFSSTVMGDVQRLPNGNTLIGYSVPSVMEEVNPDGDIVTEIDGGGPLWGYATWRPTLYGPPPNIE